VFALDVDALLDPAITLVTARDGERVFGVAALRRLGDGHAELKSMHTASEARGRGVGAALVAHLVVAARAAGCRRISLETGTGDAFAPAHRLYARAGFQPCGPFGGYPESPASRFLTLALD
jgi:putative acetyltransferase